MDLIKSILNGYLIGGIIAVVIIIAAVVVPIIRRRRAAAAQAQAEQERRHRLEEEKRKMEEAQQRRAREEAARKRAKEEQEAKDQARIDAALSTPTALKFKVPPRLDASAKTLTVTQFKKVIPDCFVVVDLETTGLSYTDDAIVEIGAVRVKNSQVTETYHTMVDPRRFIPGEATAVNGITQPMVDGQPWLCEVLPDFLEFVGDDVLVAHNAGFDGRFILQACLRYNLAIPSAFFDTMQLARYWPEADNKKQSTLLKAAGIENDQAHRALSDAEALAKFILATYPRMTAKKKKEADAE